MTLLSEAVDLVRDSTARRLEPAEARKRVDALRARHPGAGLRLLWQREEYDGSLHYDLLVREPSTVDEQAGVVSLAWCPDDALPWPLRGVQRAGEMLLLRVNGVELDVADAIGHLDVLWQEAPLRTRLVDACLVREAVDADAEDLDDAALQAAADAFRRARGLLTAEATQVWLREQRLGDRQFESLVEHQAQVARLRERVTAGRADAEVAAHPHRYDTLRLVRVDVPDADAAGRLAASTDLLTAVVADFTAGHGPAPSLVTVRPAELPAPLADAAAAAAAGDVIGPVRVAGRFVVAGVLAREPAADTAAARDTASRKLFADWVAAQRRTARIEWNWGPRG